MTLVFLERKMVPSEGTGPRILVRVLAAETLRSAGVGGREDLSGRHSNAVLVNVPGQFSKSSCSTKAK